MIDRDRLRRVIREKSELSYSRSGGPGGQNVNKRDTKVTARLDIAALATALARDLPTRPGKPSPAPGSDRALLERLRRRLKERLTSDDRLVIQSENTRSQGRNREEALERLETIVWTALRPDPRPRKATNPTKASRQRRLDAKKRRSEVKTARRRPFGDD